MKNQIGIVLLIHILSGCSNTQHPCQFKITPDYIKTNCALYNGLEIEKLKNIKLNEQEFPEEYEVDFIATYGGSGEAFSRAMTNKLNKIDFKKELKGYNWIWHGRSSVTPTIPFDFEPNNWYLISDLYQCGLPSVLLFVYVNADGSFKVYRKDLLTRNQMFP